MARIPMVTRTIITTKANVLCLDVESGEPFNEVVVLPRTYKDDKALLKQASKLIEENPKHKAVHVVDKEEVETLYGMTEQNFIALAQKLPPRGAGSVDEETEETVEADTETSDEAKTEETGEPVAETTDEPKVEETVEENTEEPANNGGYFRKHGKKNR